MACYSARIKVSSRDPFYTKTYLKHFKILYLPRYFIKLKLKLLVDFYNNNLEIFYKAIKLSKGKKKKPYKNA